MLSPEDELIERSQPPEARPCRNCGHVHTFVDGICDAYLTDFKGRLSGNCFCQAYVPADRSDILAEENGETI